MCWKRFFSTVWSRSGGHSTMCENEPLWTENAQPPAKKSWRLCVFSDRLLLSHKPKKPICIFCTHRIPLSHNNSQHPRLEFPLESYFRSAFQVTTNTLLIHRHTSYLAVKKRDHCFPLRAKAGNILYCNIYAKRKSRPVNSATVSAILELSSILLKATQKIANFC